MSKYCCPACYSDDDWYNEDRVMDLEKIVKLAQVWLELVEKRSANVIDDKNLLNRYDHDLIRY